MADQLAPRERAVLDFERDWREHQGGKQAAIRQRFGFSATRYYELLSRVVATPAALAYDPLTVRRLRRRRDAARTRSAARGLSRRLGR